MKKLSIALLSLSTLFISAAFAQDNWQFKLGPGLAYEPDFLGSKDYQLVFMPDFSAVYKDTYFISRADGLGYNMINRGGLRAGPVVSYTPARRENNDNFFRIAGKRSHALEGLGTVNSTLDAGGFVAYDRGSFSAKGEVRQASTLNHGLVADVEFDYLHTTNTWNHTVTYVIGPVAEFADSEHNNTYFGINQTQSIDSGLEQYAAGGGLVYYGLNVGASAPLNNSPFTLAIFGKYLRLADAAAKSPLVTQRGSKNQFIIGTSLTYDFT